MLWVLGLALSFAGLLVWLEFGCMFPRSGGEKVCPPLKNEARVQYSKIDLFL